MLFGDHRYIQMIRAFLTAALDIPAGEYEDLQIIDPHLERDSPFILNSQQNYSIQNF
jgi:hypothetical protein